MLRHTLALLALASTVPCVHAQLGLPTAEAVLVWDTRGSQSHRDGTAIWTGTRDGVFFRLGTEDARCYCLSVERREGTLTTELINEVLAKNAGRGDTWAVNAAPLTELDSNNLRSLMREFAMRVPGMIPGRNILYAWRRSDGGAFATLTEQQMSVYPSPNSGEPREARIVMGQKLFLMLMTPPGASTPAGRLSP